MDELRPIVFTVFEPSGDQLAASLIEEIKRRQPERPVAGYGGPAMEAAGCELLEATTAHAKMGFGAASEAKTLLRRKAQLADWLKANPIAALVPTDSPAANWSMCRAVRKVQPDAKIVHLVAPQVWAWAQWRVGRLRKLTDHVLCLLPFEPDWFGPRGVKATFVGHPLYDPIALEQQVKATTTDGQPLRDGSPKLALLPGSRPKEVAQNWPTMLAVYEQLRHRLPGMAVTVAAASPERAKQLNQLSAGGRPPRGVQVSVGQASAVLDWADAAVVVSGTATLQAASRNTPMVVLYNANMTAWKLLGRVLISARTFALPNVIGEAMEWGRLVPELVPHDGTPEPVLARLKPLLQDEAAREQQTERFDQLAGLFAGVHFRRAAADVLLHEIAAASGESPVPDSPDEADDDDDVS
jgi:lipid-A-disaccharide synthase